MLGKGQIKVRLYFLPMCTIPYQPSPPCSIQMCKGGFIKCVICECFFLDPFRNMSSKNIHLLFFFASDQCSNADGLQYILRPLFISSRIDLQFSWDGDGVIYTGDQNNLFIWPSNFVLQIITIYFWMEYYLD